jgi:hypothetical protein
MSSETATIKEKEEGMETRREKGRKIKMSNCAIS